MNGFNFPRRAEVTAGNQAVFDKLDALLGAVPNLYAGFAWSENALSTYLAMENSKSSLNARQREAIHLVVSRVNDCTYCIVAHSQIAQLNGFTMEEILEMQCGTAGFDQQLDTMVRAAKRIVENRGACEEEMLSGFYSTGLTKENLVDMVMIIGFAITANYLQALMMAPVDFPLTTNWENPLRDRER